MPALPLETKSCRDLFFERPVQNRLSIGRQREPAGGAGHEDGGEGGNPFGIADAIDFHEGRHGNPIVLREDGKGLASLEAVIDPGLLARLAWWRLRSLGGRMRVSGQSQTAPVLREEGETEEKEHSGPVTGGS